MIRKADWDAATRELVEEERRRLGPPPTEEEIAAYLDGTLSREETGRVQEQLAAYPELARALSEPFPSEDPPPGDPAFLSEHERARDWALLQSRLPVEKPASRSESAAGWKTFAIAAALAAAIFAVLFVKQRSELQQVTKQLHEPRFDLEELLLIPDGLRGQGDAALPISLPPGGDSFLLVPSLISQPEFSDYRVDIVDLSVSPQRTIWSRSGLRRRPDDTLALLVPRTFLARGGLYELVVFGVQPSGSRRLASYTVRSPQ